MSLTFRATSPTDYCQIRAFLMSVFHCDPATPSLQRSLMEWKYWEPRPDWDGSRSYVLQRKDQIVAHLSVWPVTFQTSGSSIRALHLIDWAANPGTGVGTRLLDKVAPMVDWVVGVGGSSVGRRITRKIGFVPAGEFTTFARTLRPLQQAISHQRKGWRLPLRFARNLARSLSGLQVPPGWHALAASPAQIDSWPEPHSQALYPSRNARFYKYVLRCPTAQCRFFCVQQTDRIAGYFCLSLVSGQARIAELWMESQDPAEWAVGYALASREATALGAAEIVGATSSRTGREALAAAGYHSCETLPIIVRAPNGVTTPELQMQMVDGDGFFLHHGKTDYMM